MGKSDISPGSCVVVVYASYMSFSSAALCCGRVDPDRSFSKLLKCVWRGSRWAEQNVAGG